MKKIVLVIWITFFALLVNAQNEKQQSSREESIIAATETIRATLLNNQSINLTPQIDTLEKYLHEEPDSMNLVVKYFAVFALNGYYIENNIPKMNPTDLMDALIHTAEFDLFFDPIYINCAYNMALLLEMQGLFSYAIEIYELTLKAFSKVYKNNHNLFDYNIQKKIGILHVQLENISEWLIAQEKAINIIEQIEGNKSEAYLEDLKTLALAYSFNNQYEKSDSCLFILQNYYEDNKLQGSNEYITTLNDRADTKQNLPYPEYEEAIKLYEKILSLQKKNTVAYANTLYGIGLCYRNLENFKQTLIYADKAANIAKKNPKKNFDLLFNLIVLYKHSNGMERARTLMSKLTFKTEDNLGWLSRLSSIYAMMDDYSEARKYADQAKIEADKEIQAGNTTIEFANELNLFATTLFTLSKFDDYIKYQKISLNISQKYLGKEHPVFRETSLIISSAYSFLGAYDKALNILDSLQLNEYDSEYWKIQEELANIYIWQGDYDKAIPIYEEYLKETLTPLSKYNALASLSGIYIAKAELLIDDNQKTQSGDFIDKAQNYALQTLKLSEEEFGINSEQYISSLSNIATIYYLQDSVELAKTVADKCLNIITKSTLNDSDKATYLGSIATVYVMLRDFEKAIELGEKMRQWEEKAGDKIFIAEYFNSLLLAESYLGNNNYDKAQQYYIDMYRNLSDNILKNFAYMTLKQRENYIQMYQSQLRDAGRFIDINKIHDTFSEIVYDVTLFSKGLLLRTTNDIRNAIYNSGNQSLIEQYKELQNIRQQITALKTKNEDSDSNYLQYLENEADNLDKNLTKSSIGYRNFKADLLTTWKDVQQNLLENEVAIEFIDYQKGNYSDTTLYAALILRKDFDMPMFVPLFEKSQLEKLLGSNPSNPRLLPAYIEKIYRSGNPRFFNGQKLYQLLWQPLEKYLQDVETVYYSPSGKLNQVSFSALALNDTLCLIDKYNMHLVSSTREIGKTKQNENTLLPIKDVVLYGGIPYDVDNEEELIISAAQYKKNEDDLLATRSLQNEVPVTLLSFWGDLKGTEMEVSAIEVMLNDANVPNVKYSGVEAIEESIKNLSGNSPAILYIATHGFYLEGEKEIISKNFIRLMSNPISQNPLQRSGLLFAGANRAWTNRGVISGIEDGILTAEEIANLDFSNTKLAVLSACETGLGKTQNLEGVFGLQRAFKLAGVETIIMSLWEVSDAVTQKLMISFYENLLKGYPKYEAFKKAQQSVREKEPNPYFWAAFVMMD